MVFVVHYDRFVVMCHKAAHSGYDTCMLNFTIVVIYAVFTNEHISCTVIHEDAVFYRWTCSTVCYIFCYNKFHLTMKTVRPSLPRAINEGRKTTAPVGRKLKRRRKLCRRCSWTQTVSYLKERYSWTWTIFVVHLKEVHELIYGKLFKKRCS